MHSYKGNTVYTSQVSQKIVHLCKYICTYVNVELDIYRAYIYGGLDTTASK